MDFVVDNHQPFNAASLVKFSEQCVSRSLGEYFKPRSNRKYYEAIPIPNTKQYVQYLLDFYRAGHRTTQPVLANNDSEVQVQYGNFKISAPADDTIRSVCKGLWTPYGASYQVKFSPTSILPTTIDILDAGLTLAWLLAPQIRLTWTLLKWAVVALRSFVVTPEYGRMNISGYTSPRLIWS